MTNGTMLDKTRFFRFLRLVRKASEGTLATYARRYTFFIKWLGNKPLSNDTFLDFIEDRKSCGIDDKTLNGYIHLFNLFITYFEYYEVSHSLKKQTCYKKKYTRKEVLSIKEIDAILSTELDYGFLGLVDCSFLNETVSAMLMTYSQTAMRYEELAVAKVGDLSLSDGVIWARKTKGRDERKLYIYEPLIGRLKRLTKHKNKDDYIFTNGVGNAIIRQNLARDLKKRAKKAGITKRVHLHMLRRSWATEDYKNGGDIVEIARLLGHKDIQTTFDNYISLVDDDLEKTARKHPLARRSFSPEERFAFYAKAIKEVVDEAQREGVDVMLQENAGVLNLCIVKPK